MRSTDNDVVADTVNDDSSIVLKDMFVRSLLMHCRLLGTRMKRREAVLLE